MGHMNLRSARTCQLLKKRSAFGVALGVILVGALAAAPAFAAAAFVRNIQTAANQGANEASGTSVAVTVPAAGVTAGDTVIVTFAMDPALGAVSCADSKGNTYTQDVDVTNGSGTTGVRTVV